MRRAECDKCVRFDRYYLDRLIERYGIDAKLFDWTDEIVANCPRKIANKLDDLLRCAMPGSAQDPVKTGRSAKERQTDSSRHGPKTMI